jgi:hypothetical protein
VQYPHWNYLQWYNKVSHQICNHQKQEMQKETSILRRFSSLYHLNTFKT